MAGTIPNRQRTIGNSRGLQGRRSKEQIHLEDIRDSKIMTAPNGPLALASIRVEGWGPVLPHREGQLEAFSCVFVCWVGGWAVSDDKRRIRYKLRKRTWF